jgi:hypothetical protein
VEEAFRKTGSFGLAGIRERVALLGGSCDISSRPRIRPQTREDKPRAKNTKPGPKTQKSGTKITIELPIPSETDGSRRLGRERAEQRRRVSRLRDAIAMAGAEGPTPAGATNRNHLTREGERIEALAPGKR